MIRTNGASYTAPAVVAMHVNRVFHGVFVGRSAKLAVTGEAQQTDVSTAAITGYPPFALPRTT
jgi:hypothetical protein